MIRTSKHIFLFACLLASARIWGAAEAGQPGGFLRAGVGGRAAAMGNAYAALAEGPEAVYWNPAGLAWGPRPALASTVNVLSLGRSFNSAELQMAWDPAPAAVTVTPQGQAVTNGFPMALNRGLGSWGVGWLSFSLGNDFEGRSSDTASYYSFGDRQAAYTLAHGRALFPWLSIGAGLKLYEHVIDVYSAHGQGLDLGLLLLLGPSVRLGVTGSDLFSNFQWSTGYVEHFPAMVRASLAANFWKDRIALAGQMVSTEGRQIDFGIGLETKLFTYLRLRGGWQEDGPTFGGGLALPIGRLKSQFDYAYLPDPLRQGDAQRFSLGLNF